jgi:signal transduction histidine kinase
LLCHLGYSVSTYIILTKRPAPYWIWSATIVLDLTFATAIAYLTEGNEVCMHELEAQSERESIARSLHNSYVQSLAGVNLWLETCRELLRRGRPEDLSSQLTELQIGVAREYDQVRTYVRPLAGLDDNSQRELEIIPADPMVKVRASFSARSYVAERIFLVDKPH